MTTSFYQTCFLRCPKVSSTYAIVPHHLGRYAQFALLLVFGGRSGRKEIHAVLVINRYLPGLMNQLDVIQEVLVDGASTLDLLEVSQVLFAIVLEDIFDFMDRWATSTKLWPW